MKKLIWKENRRYKWNLVPSAVISGTETGIDHFTWKVNSDEQYEETNLKDIEEGHSVLSFIPNEMTSTLSNSIVTEMQTGKVNDKVVLKIEAGENSIIFTSTHIIPFYRDGSFIEDNIGVLQVGDEVIVCDVQEFSEHQPTHSTLPIDSITIGEDLSESELLHPYTEKGYIFVNNILVEG
jgi:hypothetical protein